MSPGRRRSDASLPVKLAASVVIAGLIAVVALRVPSDHRGRTFPKIPSHFKCPEQQFGLHMDMTFEQNPKRRAAVLRAVIAVGAQVSRNSLLWSRVERKPREFDWSVPDTVIADLTTAGIEPLLVLYGSPSWANGAPRGVNRPELFVPSDDDQFSAWVQSYREFVRLAVHRYRDRVHRWEIWNEPNEENFWKPHPNARQYGRFFSTIRDTIVTQQPAADVAVGGLSGISRTTPAGIPALEFAQQLFEEGVSLANIALHPYTTLTRETSSSPHAEFSAIERLHQRFGVDIWVTEWGWSSEEVGNKRQADLVGTSLKLLRSSYPYVEIATLFLDHDRPPRFFYGLFDENLRPKPAAETFAHFVKETAPRLTTPGCDAT